MVSSSTSAQNFSIACNQILNKVNIAGSTWAKSRMPHSRSTKPLMGLFAIIHPCLPASTLACTAKCCCKSPGCLRLQWCSIAQLCQIEWPKHSSQALSSHALLLFGIPANQALPLGRSRYARCLLLHTSQCLHGVTEYYSYNKLKVALACLPN